MDKSIGIMQPYFFPYIGYFQLVKAVDEFLFFDDVNFIKKGWINRNSILVNGEIFKFSVPLYKASQNKLIKETKIHPDGFFKFKKSLLTTLEQNYKNQPYFQPTYKLVEKVMEETGSMAELAIKSVKEVAAYLKMHTQFHISSEIHLTEDKKAEERIISLCKNRNASEYLNLIGGKKLYDPEKFQQEGITLKFLETDFSKLKKYNSEESFQLSIIHLLMNHSPESLTELLEFHNLH